MEEYNQLDISVLNPENKTLSICVHDGIFHSDDVFSIALIKILSNNYSVIRTRDIDLLESADLLVDVGGEYNPSLLRFDHHQDNFNERNPKPDSNNVWIYDKEAKRKLPAEHGPKLCGFGLLYRHFSKALITKIALEYKSDITEEELNEVIEYTTPIIRLSLVCPIDAEDNGEDFLFNINKSYYKSYSLTNYIRLLNSDVEYDNTVDKDKAFEIATNVAHDVLKREIINIVSTKLSFKEIEEFIKEQNSPILVLPKFYSFGKYIYENKESTSHIQLVVFENKDTNKFMIRCVNFYKSNDEGKYTSFLSDGSFRKYRCNIPLRLRTKSETDIAIDTGISGVEFIHLAGFIVSCKNKESALEFANWLLNNSED